MIYTSIYIYLLHGIMPNNNRLYKMYKSTKNIADVHISAKRKRPVNVLPYAKFNQLNLSVSNIPSKFDNGYEAALNSFPQLSAIKATRTIKY